MAGPLPTVDMPLVTVVTPSFNQGAFIRATIESVLAQDYPAIEYVIRDGGSTDATASIARDYASRLTFVSEEDRGQSHAVNKGLQAARGSLVTWLNSDDLFLPGAVSAAVAAFARGGRAGAVYGEGDLIDREGRSLGRFPYTEPPNTWKLVHLSDFILQQTTFFRKAVLDDVGYLDESLHYVMDWDVLIRIALRYPLLYVPVPMGCLRVYPETKTWTGGLARIREIHATLRRHTGRRLPPGTILYGLDTLGNWLRSGIERTTPGAAAPAGRALHSVVRRVVGHVAGRLFLRSQGLFPDGWAGPRVKAIVPPGGGELLVEGSIPEWCVKLSGQRLRVLSGAVELGAFPMGPGSFSLRVPVPAALAADTLRLTLAAERSFVIERFRPGGDRRRVSYRLRSLRWSDEPEPAERPPERAVP